MNEFKMQRLSEIMEHEPGNSQETGGVINPAAVRGKGGHLYLFPLIVSKDNSSHIGVAGVIFNEVGDPVGIEHLGIALEPGADYEKHPISGGGCVDPRITYVELLCRYIMF